MPRDVPGFDLVGDALGRARARRFEDFPPQLQAAVNAYDQARRETHGSTEPPMSDANKATLAPMIAAAIGAFVGCIERGEC